jgi:hypothetical protein
MREPYRPERSNARFSPTNMNYVKDKQIESEKIRKAMVEYHRLNGEVETSPIRSIDNRDYVPIAQAAKESGLSVTKINQACGQDVSSKIINGQACVSMIEINKLKSEIQNRVDPLEGLAFCKS